MKDKKFPEWMKKKLVVSEKAGKIRDRLRELRLATVCRSAKCPNLNECYSCGTATFMIMGDVCTRRCRFCAVKKGNPSPLDADEPKRIALAAKEMELRHVVVTSVTRDDLPDGGAGHFAQVVTELKSAGIESVEVLTPDFQGDLAAVDTVLDARPDVFNHNVETVPSLYVSVRPSADFARSLGVLERAAGRSTAKSGVMVGLGETREELLAVFKSLAGVGVKLLTIGQYLAPTDTHYPMARFVTPAEFDDYGRMAEELGIAGVASGAFVRSSYHAAELFTGKAGCTCEG